MLLGARGRVRDWRSYDSVAEDYDRLWGRRFETAAGHLLAFAPPTPGSRLLDLGAGTGAVASALSDRLADLAIVGCDLSRPMLRRARRRTPTLRTVLTDARLLPFRGGSFDLVTGNCVLSHVRDFRQALAESLRAERLEAGFSRVWTETVEMDVRCPVDEYLAERQLGAAGRFGREALGRNRWRTFLERAADQLRHRFGDQVAYARSLIVGAAAVG